MGEGIKSTEAQVTSVCLLELVDNVGHMHRHAVTVHWKQRCNEGQVLLGYQERFASRSIPSKLLAMVT